MEIVGALYRCTKYPYTSPFKVDASKYLDYQSRFANGN